MATQDDSVCVCVCVCVYLCVCVFSVLRNYYLVSFIITFEVHVENQYEFCILVCNVGFGTPDHGRVMECDVQAAASARSASRHTRVTASVVSQPDTDIPFFIFMERTNV